MYGTRDAAQNWYQEYSEQFIHIGFRQGRASLCVFYNQEKGIRTYVHGADYVSIGMPEALKWMKGKLEAKYIVKTPTLGPSKENQQQIKILNRIVTRSDNDGLAYEADPRHIEIILKQLDVIEAKVVTSLGTRDEGRTSEDSKFELAEKEATMYRALVACCNDLSPDRQDILFSAKEFARAMAKPTIVDQQRLKRLARYLKGRPRLELQYRWQPRQSIVTTWAGCRESRKSTMGRCMKIGTHCIKGWRETQSLIALSSGNPSLMCH